jgi:hypothetical protein
MTPVTAIRGSIAAAAGAGGAARDEGSGASAEASAPARALIPLQPIARSEPALRGRPQAGFLAHLIATERKLPQTRERRRAEPAEAIAAYTASGTDTAWAGRRVFRVT